MSYRIRISQLGNFADGRNTLKETKMKRDQQMPKLERTENGYAVEGRQTFIFKVLKTWFVTFRTWSGARETKEFKTLEEAKKFALGQE